MGARRLRLPAQETFPAVNRTALRRLERHRRFPPALRAGRHGFRLRDDPEDDPPWRFVLQVLQRLGSFLKFLSWKKCCSPAVNTNSAPHSAHLRIRS